MKSKHVLRPSLFSCHYITGGNGQTIMTSIKDNFQKKRGEFKYTSREIFTLKDGGKIYIDYMGQLEQSTRPILFVVPGLTSTSQSGYIRDVVN